MPRKTIPDSQIIEALEKTNGNIREAAPLLEVHEHALYNRIHRSEKLKDILHKIRRENGFAETSGNTGTKYYVRTDEEIIEALQETKGIIYYAADLLGMTRSNLDNRIRKNEKLQEALIDAREGVIDLAEAKLFKKLDEDQWNAIEFVLRRLGKNRGYGDEQTINMNANLLELQINYDFDLLTNDEKVTVYELLSKCYREPDTD